MSSHISTPVFRNNSNETSSESPRCLHPSISCNLSTDSSPHQQLVLAIAWLGGKLGAAYYDIATHELWIVPDISDGNGSSSLLNSLFFQLQPYTLIIKQNLDEHLMANIYQLTGLYQSTDKVELEEPLVTKQSTCTKTTSLENKKNCLLYMVPSSFYNAKAAFQRLRSLRLEASPTNMTNTEYCIYLKSIFPSDCPALLQATGALLKTLEQWKTGQDVDHLIEANANSTFMKIFSIRTHRIEDSLWMDPSSFFSLNIFSEEAHPSAFKKGHQQSAKEGFSLFGLASRCHSTAGSFCLKNIFLRPIRNVQTLQERYSVIEFCKEPSNVEVVRDLISSLKRISDLKVPLLNISTMQCSLNNWRKVLITARNLVALSDKCKALPQEIPLFKRFTDSEQMRKWQCVVDIIYRLVNFDESKRVGRCIVNFGVDEDLDRLKREYNNIHHVYIEVAHKEMENLPSFIEKGVIEFFPSLGHCLCLRSWLPDNQPITSQVSIPGLELKFFTSDNLYFKNRRCYELDDEFGDFAAKVLAHEMSVIFAASRAIIDQSHSIIEGVELAGYLDALLSLSGMCSEFEMVKPELIQHGNGKIDIVKGRHILLQLVSEQYNPNCTLLGGGNERANCCVNIILGPNSSGKSVYLKQTALIVYLAHIGCFVPAERVSLTPLEHLFVVGHPPETLVTSLSYFAVELSLMSAASKEAKNRSLVIVDEFGTGSSLADGSAIFISCIENWIQQSEDCPLILAATHFHNAVAYLSRFRSSKVQFSSMGYLVHHGELVFTYRLDEKKCTSSFPLSIAHAAGLPEEIIKRAREVLEALDSVGSIPLHSLNWNEKTFWHLRSISETFATSDFSSIEKVKHILRRVNSRRI